MFGRRHHGTIYVPDAGPAYPMVPIVLTAAGLLTAALLVALWLQPGASSRTGAEQTADVPAAGPTQPTAPASPEAEPSATAKPEPASHPASSPATEPASGRTGSLGQLYAVISVTDGDTLRVSYDGASEPVRLIGIDSPETVDPNRSTQCFGRDASDFLQRLLVGKQVHLVRDGMQGDRDPYDRLLRFVYLEDGTNVNETLVRQGFATFEAQYPIAEPFRSELQEAETEAIQSGAGLWTACN